MPAEPLVQSRLILLSSLPAETLASLKPDHIVSDLAGLSAVDPTDALLVAFGTGVIVPPSLLGGFSGRAYNLHAASPDFPGRDPHHWAIYVGAARYGATFHRMAASVDSGPILATELFDVPNGASPGWLLANANAAGFRLLERLIPRLRGRQVIEPEVGWAWGPVKRTRKDFVEMCRIEPDMDADEVARRYRAFHVSGYTNLYIELHGLRFHLDDRS